MTANPPPFGNIPSEQEQYEAHAERTISELKEALAFARAARALYFVHLERMVDAFDDVADVVGIDGVRVIEGAKKALGRSYDADALGEYGDDGRAF